MGNVGQLNANLTLGSAQFNAALDDAQNRAGKFHGAVGAGTGNFVKFNTHMLESRRTMRLLGEAAGTHLGQVTSFVHAFGMFGPVAGAAVVGFILLQDYINSTAEKLKHANEENRDFFKTLRDIRMEAQGLEFNRAARELNRLGEVVVKVKKELLEAEQAAYWRTILKGTFIKRNALAEEMQRDPHVQELQAQLRDAEATAKLIKEEAAKRGEKGPDIIRRGSEHHGGGLGAHILRAVHGAELGALKLEHSSPLVDLLKKSVDIQEKTLKAIEEKPFLPPFINQLEL
jgi:hypothetical protein